MMMVVVDDHDQVDHHHHPGAMILFFEMMQYSKTDFVLLNLYDITSKLYMVHKFAVYNL